MAAQLSEYTNTIYFYALNGSIVWCVNYVSIKMSLKKKRNHEKLKWNGNNEDGEGDKLKRDYRGRLS